MLSEAQARLEICRVGQSLFQRGYVHATAGHISVRLADGFLITPTDACLGFLQPEQLSRLSAEGAHLSGDKPSNSIALHRAVYAADASASCVLHTHSTHCVLLSGGRPRPELLNPITPYFVMKVGHVPLVPYRLPGDDQVPFHVTELIERYSRADTPIRAVMLARLGPVVWHGSPMAAMAVLEELEETAKLEHLHPRQRPLSREALDALQARFGCKW